MPRPTLVVALCLLAVAWSASVRAQQPQPQPQPAPPPTTTQEPAPPPPPAPMPRPTLRGPLTAPAPSTTPAPDPNKDQRELADQGKQRPANDGGIPARAGEVYSEDWWGRARPILELHGYFRTRAELFHNFALGRHAPLTGDDQNLWAQPLDNTYTD